VVNWAIVAFFLVFSSLASASESEGERLAYVLGCVNCHHQTPKDIINAPPLLIVQAYSLEKFTLLMKTGVTSTGRDLSEIGSIMGIVAVEQFSHLNDEEILTLYNYLKIGWSHEQAMDEEKKIPRLYKFEEKVFE
jgi:hypothetical protein